MNLRVPVVVQLDEIPAKLRPGLYCARADAPAFAELYALVLAGEAALIGTKWDVDGEKVIAVSVADKSPKASQKDFFGRLLRVQSNLHGMRPNATIGIGAQFFSTALRTYRGWQEAWWREAIQNSVDAGATKLTCCAEKLPDGNVRVSITDNGQGMSREILLDKFLVLGGTTKGAGSGSTGGFGKAKELLILPWLGWEIQTLGLTVTGENISYEVRETPHFAGTRLTVIMPENASSAERATTVKDCSNFLQKCHLPGVKITLSDGAGNDEECTWANLKAGEPMRSFGSGTAEVSFAEGHKKKQRIENNILFRAKTANGRGSLFMWSEYCPDAIKGQLVVEILKPTIELLNDNRQSWRNYLMENQISAFKNELAADTKSALKKKTKEPERIKYEGTGTFKTDVQYKCRQRAAAFMGATAGFTDEATLANKKKLNELIENLVEVAREAEKYEPELPPGDVTGFGASPALVELLLGSMKLKTSSQLVAASKQLAWKPSFYLYSEIEGYKIPKRFRPEGMTPPIRKMARMWAELCRAVLTTLGSESEFGVGFLFDDGSNSEGSRAAASCVTEGGENWLLINPLKSDDDVLSISDEDDLYHMFACAVHECTHMFDRISRHNEEFSSAITKNFGLCARLAKELPAIKKIVLAEERMAPKPEKGSSGRTPSPTARERWV
jgi:hypothetical protein